MNPILESYSWTSTPWDTVLLPRNETWESCGARQTELEFADRPPNTSSAFFEKLKPKGEVMQAGGQDVGCEGRLMGWVLCTDSDGLLSQALLLGELRSAVELCLKEEHFADAIILAQAGGAELLKWTQEHYLAKRRTKISPVLPITQEKKEWDCLGLDKWRPMPWVWCLESTASLR